MLMSETKNGDIVRFHSNVYGDTVVVIVPDKYSTQSNPTLDWEDDDVKMVILSYERGKLDLSTAYFTRDQYSRLFADCEVTLLRIRQ